MNCRKPQPARAEELSRELACDWHLDDEIITTPISVAECEMIWLQVNE